MQVPFLDFGVQHAGIREEIRSAVDEVLESQQFILGKKGAELERAIDDFLTPMAALDPTERRGWICGLGHGVLPTTPPESVRTFVRAVRTRLA